MPALILPLIEAAAHWPERGALIGLDLGTKTIGVAVSDPDRRLATGVETIARKAFKADAARLLALAAERNVAGFVLGLPINMDGSEGPRAQSTRAFARNFAKLTALPIGLWDERLSTTAVERALIPIFLLIVMGLLLRRWLIADDAHWVGLERLLYYVMFPALLIGTMARAD